MFLFVEVERCALERAASVRRRGTEPADAKHFDWRTTFVAMNSPRPDTTPRAAIFLTDGGLRE
jgi:hypothetical protein